MGLYAFSANLFLSGGMSSHWKWSKCHHNTKLYILIGLCANMLFQSVIERKKNFNVGKNNYVKGNN